MKNLKELTIFKQEVDYTCGPAVLRSIVSWFRPHHKVSESHIAKIAETNSEVGTSREKMEHAVKELGLKFSSKYEGTLEEVKEELNKGRPVVAYFWHADENPLETINSWFHYAIFTEVTDDKVYLADPWHGETVEYAIKDFLPFWYCDNGKKGWWASIFE